MKTLVLCCVLAGAVCAQVEVQSGQIPPGQITPQTVVAKIDGHDFTMADYQRILQTWPPQLTSAIQQNPVEVLRQIYTMKYLGEEGEKLKLGDDEPLKGQLEAMRTFMMAQAETSYDRNHFSVSEEDIRQYYEKNKARFQQAKIRVIKIGLQEPIPLGGADAVQKAAQVAAQNDRAPKRSEGEAKALAAEILKKLHAGDEFAALARQYSDDADSKAKGGDFGTMTPTSAYPEEMKNAVFALKAGEVSEPVRQPNSLYIIRVDEVSFQPVDKLNGEIINQLRDAHLRAVGMELGKRFTPQLVHPEAFLPTGRPPQSK